MSAGSRFVPKSGPLGGAHPNPAAAVLELYKAMLVERDRELVASQGRSITLRRIVAVAGEQQGGPVRYELAEVAEPFSFQAVAPPAAVAKSRKARGRPAQASAKRTRALVGGELLDQFFAGGAPWRDASDAEVWTAAVEFVLECGGERGEVVPPGQGAWLEEPPDVWRLRPPLSGLLYPLNAVVNLGLVHRAGGVSVRLQDVAGRQ